LEIAGVAGLDERHAKKVSDYRALRPLAEQAGVPFASFDKVTEPQVQQLLEAQQPDWLFIIGLSQLVPADLRNRARAGAIGFHPTLLPEGRGRAPVAWTILLQRPAAANLFFLTDEPDAGDIVEQRPVEVRPNDYAADLIARTNVVLEQMVADLSPAFAAGDVPRRPQDHSKATYYGRRRPGDGLIHWDQTAEEVHRLIRAVSHPYPGAFTSAKGRRITIWRAELSDEEEAGTGPGTVIDWDGDHPVVQTGSGLLRLTDIETVGEAGDLLEIGAALG
jgi:methionyl-tRNA formyltransferase